MISEVFDEKRHANKTRDWFLVASLWANVRCGRRLQYSREDDRAVLQRQT